MRDYIAHLIRELDTHVAPSHQTLPQGQYVVIHNGYARQYTRMITEVRGQDGSYSRFATDLLNRETQI